MKMGSRERKKDMEEAAEDTTGARAETAQQEEQTQSAGEKIAELEQQLMDMEDRLLRATAEFENYKKRRNRETEDLLRYGNESLIRELLPVMDSFERAILSGEGNRDYQAFHDGIELILQQLRDVLNRAGVERLWPEGEQFDPHRHEAIGVCAHDEIEPEHIATVVEPGYEIHGRVVRPPKVLVVRTDDQPSDQEPAESE